MDGAIDVSDHMYEAFQACRLGRPHGRALVQALRPILERVRELGTFWLAEDDPCLAGWSEPIPVGAQRLGAPAERALTARNQLLFDVIDRAAADLERLSAADVNVAPRNLGYAMHPLPGLLASPDEFARDHYVFSLKFIAYHWRELSEELKVALARLLRIQRDRLEAVVGREGFARSMYRAPARR